MARGYIRKTTSYGPFTEIKKYHTPMYGNHGTRRKREKPSSEAVKEYNRKMVIDRLYKKMVCNFVPVKDYFLTLTLDAKYRSDPEKAHELFCKKFIPAMRKAYKREGLEFKYIFSVGGFPAGIHFHVVINSFGGKSINELMMELWPYGSVKSMEPLYKDYDWWNLAAYMVKNSFESYKKPGNPFRQIYTPSRNLKKPEERVEIIKAGKWRQKPDLSEKQKAAGLRIVPDSVVVGTDIWGFDYQRYVIENLRRSRN